MQHAVTRLADSITELTGRPWAWVLSVIVVAVWVLGLLHYGVHDAGYLLVIQTISSVITLVMVFLIQHSTERSNRAVELKLDALIAAQENTENKIIGVEERPAAEIKKLQEEAREQLREAEEEEQETGERD